MKPQLELLETSSKNSSFKSFLIRETGFQDYWHFHPEIELTYITKGAGIRFIGDDVSSFEQGDLVLLGSHLPHSWLSQRKSDGVEAYVIQFRKDLFESFPECNPLQKLFSSASYGLSFTNPNENLVASLKQVVTDSGISSLFKLMAVLFLLSSRDGNTISSKNYSGAEWGNKSLQRIEQATSYIYAHYQQQISLDDVADHCSLTPQSFSRWFKLEMGQNYLDYLNQIRVEHACRLLSGSKMSMTDIAFESGFENSSTFNRVFKKWRSDSPRDFRKKHS